MFARHIRALRAVFCTRVRGIRIFVFTKDERSLEDFPKSAQGLFQRCAGSRMPCEIMRFHATRNLNYSTILVKSRSVNAKVAMFH